jgi:hypothetical protein
VCPEDPEDREIDAHLECYKIPRGKDIFLLLEDHLQIVSGILDEEILLNPRMRSI